MALGRYVAGLTLSTGKRIISLTISVGVLAVSPIRIFTKGVGLDFEEVAAGWPD